MSLTSLLKLINDLRQATAGLITKGLLLLRILNGKRQANPNLKRVFGSVVAGTFQIIFRIKMHVNDVFLFLKNYF